MSQLLVCAVDQAGATRYKQGDIVDVRLDGAPWGTAEVLPAFWQITVTSLADGDRAPCLEPSFDPAFLNPRLLRRRKRFIDITQLSNFTQNNLANTGKATVLRVALIGALTLRTG